MFQDSILRWLTMITLAFLTGWSFPAMALSDSINTLKSNGSHVAEIKQTPNCPERPAFKIPGRPHLARLAFMLTGGRTTYEVSASHRLTEGCWIPAEEIFPEGFIYSLEKKPLKKSLCIYTSQDSLKDITSLTFEGRSKRQTERRWVNLLLGNFLLGDGPENLLLGPESQPADILKDARIVKQAVREFLSMENHTIDTQWTFHQRFWLSELLNTIGQPLSLRHFIGSAEIRIAYCNNSTLCLTLINITSVTSADITTHIRKPHRWPKSIPRNNPNQPMTNTCQVIQITIPLVEAQRMTERARFRN